MLLKLARRIAEIMGPVETGPLGSHIMGPVTEPDPARYVLPPLVKRQ